MRKSLFWTHLICGSVAAIVILIMCVTGVLLMYERQMLEWADRGFRSVPVGPRLGPEALLKTVAQQTGSAPGALTLRSDPAAPAEVGAGRDVRYVDVYTGRVLGEGSQGIRRFFRAVTDWHRWLALEGPRRQFGRSVTGAANLVFLGLALSGIYLWLPRKWAWQNVRAVLLFRGGLSGKARDFNWHNVIGIWSAIPLVFVILGAVVISYPWATDLVYRAAGETPPARPESGGGPPGAKKGRPEEGPAEGRGERRKGSPEGMRHEDGGAEGRRGELRSAEGRGAGSRGPESLGGERRRSEVLVAERRGVEGQGAEQRRPPEGRSAQGQSAERRSSEGRGEERRSLGAPAAGEERGNDRPIEWHFAGLDAAWKQAEARVPAWQSISWRAGGGPRLNLSIAASHRGRVDLRSTLVVDRATGEVVQHETFEQFTRGRQWRLWLRFIHTGEALGVVGQTLAGLVSAGGAVLVWTGLALTWRRFRAWRARRNTKVETPELVGQV
jgi:uncharacterized iron-regulated membrane protein